MGLTITDLGLGDAAETAAPQPSPANDEGVCLCEEPFLNCVSRFDPPLVPEPNRDTLAAGLLHATQLYQQMNVPQGDDVTTVTTPSGQVIPVYTSTVVCGENHAARAVLAGPTQINGLWFAVDEPVEFHDNLSFKSGFLDSDQLAPSVGWKLRGSTKVEYDDEESLQESSHLVSADVVSPLVQFGQRVFAIDPHVTFHDNGTAQKIIPVADVTINGTRFMGREPLVFTEEGDFYEGVLAEKKNYYGIDFYPRTRISYHPGGEFFGADLPANVTWKQEGRTYKLSANHRIEVSEDGILLRATYNQDVTIEIFGKIVVFPAGSEVATTAGGIFVSALSSKPVNIGGIDFAAGHEIAIDEDGYLKGSLAHETKIPGLKLDIVFAEGGECELDENGVFHGGDSTAEVTLKGYEDDFGRPIVMREGWFSFYDDGSFRKARLKTDVRLNGVWFKGGEKFAFHKNKQFWLGTLYNDLNVFPEDYGDEVWFAQGTEYKIDEKGRIKGTLLKGIALNFDFGGKDVVLYLTKGQRARFYGDNHKLMGGYVNNDVALWDDITIERDHWFELIWSDVEGEEDQIVAVGVVLDEPPEIVVAGKKVNTDDYMEFYPSGNLFGVKILDEFEAYPDLYPGLTLGGDRWVRFFDDESLQVSGSRLAADFKPFPDLYDDPDNPLVLAQDQWVEIKREVLVDGGQEEPVLAGGKLAHDFSFSDPTFGEITLAMGEWVDLDEFGRILGGRLSADVSLAIPGFDDLVLVAGEWVDINWDDSGFAKLVGGKLAGDATYFHKLYGAIHFAEGGRVEFYPDGLFKGGILAKALHLQNEKYGQIDLQADEWFELYEDGSFKSGTLGDDLYILNPKTGPFYILGNNFIYLYPYPQDTLAEGVLADTMCLQTPVGPLWLQEYKPIELDENQDFLSGYVAKSYTINGETYHVGDWIDVSLILPDK